jgi:hypothetical protein
MTTTEQLKHLFSEFPKEDVHWRAQSVTKAGDKAMALAYIDARNVMDRLDQIVGTENWQDRYEVHGQRTICYLSIRVEGEWITKADGAGTSDIEAEKGAMSDSFKRAAVKWGIGRYLYEMPAPWVPCESYERNNKRHWRKWTADPWDYVGKQKPKTQDARAIYTELQNQMHDFKTREEARIWWSSDAVKESRSHLPGDWVEDLAQAAASLPEGGTNAYAEATMNPLQAG